MLSEFAAVPVLAVTDLARARSFYEDTLGFSPGQEMPDGVLYRAGAVDVLVYQSSYAGTNQATAVSFDVPGDAFDGEVSDLRGRGLTFQTFEAEGLSWTDGVAEGQGMRAVWFADPDGNILNVATYDEEAAAGARA